MSQEKSREWVLERIKKLLALGKNEGATDGERDNAMRMAHKLLSKYNLDEAEAEAHGAKPTEARGFVRASFYGRPWARTVASAIAKLYFCEYVYMGAEKAADTQHFFFGKQSNSAAAAAIAQWLVESIRREGRKATPPDEGNAWFRSFCTGAAVVIYQRVEVMIAEANKAQAEPGMSLVLASVYASEKAKNLIIRDTKFPKMKSGRSGKRDGSHEGVAAGKKYGAGVSLNRQVGGSTQKQIGG